MPEDIESRASRYASRRGLSLGPRLGSGKDGIVYSTSSATAIKVHRRQATYDAELACYRRLAEHQVVDVREHHVPKPLDHDDELLVIEMSVVSRPYLLDFVDAHLDAAPDFPDEVIEQWHEEKREQFGDRWNDVQMVMAILRGRYGIHLLDVNPGNVTFGEGEE